MTTVETATYGVTLYDGEDANGLANIVGMLLEIVDSRIAGWDITLGDTIADNASCGLYVLGDVQPRQSLPDLTTITMTMTENGTLASRGVGADCLGSPWRAWRGWRTSADPSDRRFAPARSCSPAPSAPWSPSNRARHTPRRSPASAPHGFDNLGQSRLTEPTRRPRASQAGIHSTRHCYPAADFGATPRSARDARATADAAGLLLGRAHRLVWERGREPIGRR